MLIFYSLWFWDAVSDIMVARSQFENLKEQIRSFVGETEGCPNTAVCLDQAYWRELDQIL